MSRPVPGGVNWIPENPRLSPTENLESEHVDSNCPIHARHDTDTTVLSCLFLSVSLDLSNNLFLHCCAAVGKISTDTSRRAVRLRYGSRASCFAVWSIVSRIKVKVKGKASPYSITERRGPELIPVLGSQPAGDVSHKPDGRLPLLSARPPRAAARFAAW